MAFLNRVFSASRRETLASRSAMREDLGLGVKLGLEGVDLLRNLREVRPCRRCGG
jgi:hypothetical protein